ncbi:MAG: discoidin domain-containing protein [Myxococcales bacterium]|nr:discoidin domain-containing protein [Myxococcales bacterium]
MQKLDAASVLRRSGRRVEAARLTAQATRLLLDASDHAGLTLSRIDREALAVVEAALPDDATAVDRLDPRQEEAVARLREAAALLARHVLPFARTDRERLQAQLTRLLTVALVLVAVFFGARRILRPRPTASASAVHGPRFAADQAVDGDETTEWLLPDYSPGWLDLTLAKPRVVRRVVLTNARNRPGPDRSTVDFRVEFFSRGVSVRTLEGTFGAFDPLPSRRTIASGVGVPVDRVRIHVVTWTGQGAGLAEASLE